jgi:positive regulator of sigma E activity
MTPHRPLSPLTIAVAGLVAMGALIYVGPGLGIVVSGLAATALVHLQVPAAWGWAAFGLLAALMTAGVWRVFDARRAQPAAAQA